MESTHLLIGKKDHFRTASHDKQSICLGIFPSKLKCAKIIPVFKDEDDTLPENYRPTSLLSIYDRIFEKLMNSRLTTFVKDCNIL